MSDLERALIDHLKYAFLLLFINRVIFIVTAHIEDNTKTIFYMFL